MDTPTSSCPARVADWRISTSRPPSAYGSGFSNTPWTMLNMAVVAPMPRPSVPITASGVSGLATNHAGRAAEIPRQRIGPRDAPRIPAFLAHALDAAEGAKRRRARRRPGSCPVGRSDRSRARDAAAVHDRAARRAPVLPAAPGAVVSAASTSTFGGLLNGASMRLTLSLRARATRRGSCAPTGAAPLSAAARPAS